MPLVRALTFKIGVYPGFPTPFWGLSGFFVGDLIGKALWELVENAQRFPRHGGRVLCVHGAVSFHRARPCATRWLPGRGPCVMSNWTAASSDCSRPANNYVRVNTVDLYTPNARFTQERLGYQVLTLFGKLGYSLKLSPSWKGGEAGQPTARSTAPAAPSARAEGAGDASPCRASRRPPRAPSPRCLRPPPACCRGCAWARAPGRATPA